MIFEITWCSVSVGYLITAVMTYLTAYVIQVVLDLPLCEGQNVPDSPSDKHFELRQLVQRVLDEVAKLPEMLNHSGLPLRPEEHLPYFSPKKYEQLLATAVLNKVVEDYRNPKNFEDVGKNPKQPSTIAVPPTTGAVTTGSAPTNETATFDINHNKVPGINSLNEINIRQMSLNTEESQSTEDQHQRSLSESDESYLSDYIQKHTVPLPDLSDTNGSGSGLEDDLVSLKSNTTEGTSWEENWLFRKRQLKATESVIAMLVPSPTEEVKALIGDQIVDDVSDLSEAASDVEDYESDSNNAETSESFLLNHSETALEDPVQDSLISLNSIPSNEPTLSEAKNSLLLAEAESSTSPDQLITDLISIQPTTEKVEASNHTLLGQEVNHVHLRMETQGDESFTQKEEMETDDVKLLQERIHNYPMQRDSDGNVLYPIGVARSINVGSEPTEHDRKEVPIDREHIYTEHTYNAHTSKVKQHVVVDNTNISTNSSSSTVEIPNIIPSISKNFPESNSIIPASRTQSSTTQIPADNPQQQQPLSPHPIAMTITEIFERSVKPPLTSISEEELDLIASSAVCSITPTYNSQSLNDNDNNINPQDNSKALLTTDHDDGPSVEQNCQHNQADLISIFSPTDPSLNKLPSLVTPEGLDGNQSISLNATSTNLEQQEPSTEDANLNEDHTWDLNQHHVSKGIHLDLSLLTDQDDIQCETQQVNSSDVQDNTNEFVGIQCGEINQDKFLIASFENEKEKVESRDEKTHLLIDADQLMGSHESNAIESNKKSSTTHHELISSLEQNINNAGLLQRPDLSPIQEVQNSEPIFEQEEVKTLNIHDDRQESHLSPFLIKPSELTNQILNDDPFEASTITEIIEHPADSCITKENNNVCTISVMADSQSFAPFEQTVRKGIEVPAMIPGSETFEQNALFSSEFASEKCLDEILLTNSSLEESKHSNELCFLQTEESDKQLENDRLHQASQFNYAYFNSVDDIGDTSEPSSPEDTSTEAIAGSIDRVSSPEEQDSKTDSQILNLCFGHDSSSETGRAARRDSISQIDDVILSLSSTVSPVQLTPIAAVTQQMREYCEELKGILYSRKSPEPEPEPETIKPDKQENHDALEYFQKELCEENGSLTKCELNSDLINQPGFANLIIEPPSNDEFAEKTANCEIIRNIQYVEENISNVEATGYLINENWTHMAICDVVKVSPSAADHAVLEAVRIEYTATAEPNPTIIQDSQTMSDNYQRCLHSTICSNSTTDSKESNDDKLPSPTLEIFDQRTQEQLSNAEVLPSDKEQALLTIKDNKALTNNITTNTASASNIAIEQKLQHPPRFISETDIISIESDALEPSLLESQPPSSNVIAIEPPINTDGTLVEENFIPGSNSERDILKWRNASPIPNNPYSPDVLQKRLSDSNRKSNLVDLDRLTNKDSDVPTECHPNSIRNEDKSDEQNRSMPSVIVDNPTQQHRYGRDYYINDSKRASGSRKDDTTISHSTDDEKDSSTSPQTSSPVVSPSRGINTNLQTGVFPFVKSSSCGNVIPANKTEDIFSAGRPVQVDPTDPILQKGTKLDYLSTPAHEVYLIPANDPIISQLLESSSEQSIPNRADESLTLSEDSDITRIYEIGTGETKLVQGDVLQSAMVPTVTPPPTPDKHMICHEEGFSNQSETFKEENPEVSVIFEEILEIIPQTGIPLEEDPLLKDTTPASLTIDRSHLIKPRYVQVKQLSPDTIKFFSPKKPFTGSTSNLATSAAISKSTTEIRDIPSTPTSNMHSSLHIDFPANRNNPTHEFTIEKEVMEVLPSVKELAKCYNGSSQHEVNSALKPIVKPTDFIRQSSDMLHDDQEARSGMPQVPDKNRRMYCSTSSINAAEEIREIRRLNLEAYNRPSFVPMAPGHSITARSLSKQIREELKTNATDDHKVHSGHISPERPSSPVFAPGHLRSSIQFFESLKDKQGES